MEQNRRHRTGVTRAAQFSQGHQWQRLVDSRGKPTPSMIRSSLETMEASFIKYLWETLLCRQRPAADDQNTLKLSVHQSRSKTFTCVRRSSISIASIFLERVGHALRIRSAFETYESLASRDRQESAVKFYTQEGNWDPHAGRQWDPIGDNIPIFFV